MIDEDIAWIFLEEATDLMNAYEAEVSSLKTNKHAEYAFFFRAVHNLKGASSSVGLDELAMLFEKNERVIDALIAGYLNLLPSVVSLFDETHQFISTWLSELKHNIHYIPELGTILAKYDRLINVAAENRGGVNVDLSDFGQIAQEILNVTPDKVKQATIIQNRKIGEIMVDAGMISDDDVAKVLATQNEIREKHQIIKKKHYSTVFFNLDFFKQQTANSAESLIQALYLALDKDIISHLNLSLVAHKQMLQEVHKGTSVLLRELLADAFAESLQITNIDKNSSMLIPIAHDVRVLDSQKEQVFLKLKQIFTESLKKHVTETERGVNQYSVETVRHLYKHSIIFNLQATTPLEDNSVRLETCDLEVDTLLHDGFIIIIQNTHYIIPLFQIKEVRTSVKADYSILTLLGHLESEDDIENSVTVAVDLGVDTKIIRIPQIIDRTYFIEAQNVRGQHPVLDLIKLITDNQECGAVYAQE